MPNYAFVEKRVHGNAVCRPTATGGVGGLGGRAEGCIEHIVLDVGDVGLCAVCGEAGAQQVFVGLHISCFGSIIEADGGDAAVCSAFVGLLAAEAFSVCTEER